MRFPNKTDATLICARSMSAVVVVPPGRRRNISAGQNTYLLLTEFEVRNASYGSRLGLKSTGKNEDP